MYFLGVYSRSLASFEFASTPMPIIDQRDEKKSRRAAAGRRSSDGSARTAQIKRGSAVLMANQRSSRGESAFGCMKR